MIAPVRFAQWSSCALVCVLALLAAPAALGGVPPNPHDPCVTGVRNTCNTTGVGFYRTFRYGTRWFGDFRNAIPGTTHTFCIDLRFWYPGADYRYREDTSGGNLGNKEGEAVPLPNQVQTGDGGVARVTLTPTGAPLRLSVTTAALPSTLPRIFQPTSPSATINGQRLVLPSSQVLTDAATGNATKTQIQVSTAAKP